MEGKANKLHSLIGSEARGIHLGLCFLRVCFSLALVSGYGWSRLMHAGNYLFQGQELPFLRIVTSLRVPLPVAFATASAQAESVCAVLLAAGLLTRVNASLLAFNMFSALTLVLSGGGKYSLDALLTRRSSYRASTAALHYPRPETHPTVLG